MTTTTSKYYPSVLLLLPSLVVVGVLHTLA